MNTFDSKGLYGRPPFANWFVFRLKSGGQILTLGRVPNITSYTELVGNVLPEAGKYFGLLLLVVLSVRLWRRAVKTTGAPRRASWLLAGLVTVFSVWVGWIAITHSMSRLYFHFGMEAFRATRLDPAFSLFDESWRFHKNADALGGEGICLLLSGHPEAGFNYLNNARAMRHGQGTPFEDFYQGLVDFYVGDQTNAVPLLQSAGADPDYNWPVLKLFAVIDLDQQQPQAATQLMQPYLDAEVTDPDQAYIMARLKMAGGKNAEALALANEFSTTNATPYWKKRLEDLKTKLQNTTGQDAQSH
jgi:hypothetical protein